MSVNPKPFRLGYQRSLDGLRGVSILLVLLAHGKILADGYAFIAVNTFFVLSGFLITCLLISEWDATQGVSLRQFYLRRALRLLPGLLVLLVAFLAYSFWTNSAGRARQEFYEALRALFYFTNWAQSLHLGRTISLAHTWSLSVEEQFYFIWPLLLLFLLRKTPRPSLLCWILLGMFLSVMIRVALFAPNPSDWYGYPYRLLWGSDTRADALLAGCFAGILVSSHLLPQDRWFAKSLKAGAFMAGPGLLVLGSFWSLSPWMVYVGWCLASIFAAVLITYLVTTSQSFIHGLLENWSIVYIGTISYGLYLWHYPILLALQRQQLPWQNLAYLLVVIPPVLTSYYLVEKPCLRLKQQFARIKD